MADDAGLVQLAARLRTLRGETGLTLRELSRKVHVSDSSLSRYFAAQALPPWEVVEALADLAGADKVELRGCWESVTSARKRARWSESGESAADRQPIPLWEPEFAQPAPLAAVTTGRRVGLLVGVAVLVAAAGAAGWSLRSDGPVAAPTALMPSPATMSPPVETVSASTSPTPASTPAPGPTVRDRPAGIPPAPPRSVKPTASPSHSHQPTPTPPVPRSGTIVALANGDSSPGSVPFVIDVADWSVDDGARVHLWVRRTDGDYRNQLWTPEKLSSGRWRLVNVFSRKCLYHNADGSVSQTGCADDTTQQWTFERGGEIRSADNGDCMEIQGHQRITDAVLQTAPCDGRWYQLWRTEQRSPD